MKIIRKRIIPHEEVDISADELLIKDNNVIITRWLPIKPRKDIGYGISLLDINSNYKVSAFYDKSAKFLYWYCDIVIVSYNKQTDTYIIKDLLVDVIKYPGQEAKLLDVDELEIAFLNKLISKDEYMLANNVSSLVYRMFNENIPEKIQNLLKYDPPSSFVFS